MKHQLVTGRRGRAVLVASTAVLAMVAGSGTAYAAPGPAPAAAASAAAPSAAAPAATEGGDPVLDLQGGETLEGVSALGAEATVEGDPVTALTIADGSGSVVKTLTDGSGASKSPGTSYLDLDMGGNGTGAEFGDYFTVNGHGEAEADKADRNYLPTIAGGDHGSLPFPTKWLHDGENTITVHADGAPTYYAGTSSRPNVPAGNWHVNPNGEGVWCINKDDFTISSLSVSSLGVVVDGEANNFSYTLSDGICGDGGTKVDKVDLTFIVSGEPGSTHGLRADLDTRELANGDYTLTATTASGADDSAAFSINNSPAGAPQLRPSDGTVVHGDQPVTAAVRVGDEGTVASLEVDDEPARNAETLASGTATLRLTVASGNSIESRYHNRLEVNGHRVSLGGDYGETGSEQVEVELPNRYLRPGANTIAVVTGDYNGTSGGATCANRDDFKIWQDSVQLLLGTGTATLGTAGSSGVVKTGTADGHPTWNLGDGTCGAAATNMVDLVLPFTVEGAPTTRTIDTLGSGDAHLRMWVGGNGADEGYDNVVRVNGIELPLGLWAQETADLVLPNEYLVPGTNVVEIVAGSNHGSLTPGGCDNYDDFLVRDVELVPAAGAASPLTRFVAEKTVTIGSSTYSLGQPITTWFGDGNCGSSFNSTYDAQYRFELTAEDGTALPPQGLRADLDSTELADGRHTVTATVGEKSSTRRFTVDNSAPVVTSSVPAAGQRLTSTVVLAMQLEDATGVASSSIQLDGQPITNGTEIGHGLAAGPHVLSVATVDSLGNAATRTVEFTSVSIPEIPSALDSTVEGESAELSATLGGEEGVPMTATFTQADVVLPMVGYQGTAAEVPTRLDVAGDPVTRIRSLQPFDSRTIDTPSSGDVVFQRYDLAVGTDATAPVLRWEGVIDPARTVSLRAWDTRDEEWVVLTSARGRTDGNTVLTAPTRPAFLDDGTVHVLVTGEDPFADDLSPHDASAQDDKDRFEDPKDYDFALTHFTDTQYLAEGAAGGTYDDWDGIAEDSDVMEADEQAIWQAAYRSTTEWIAANAEERKIAYNAHTGDVIENDYHNPDLRNASGELVRPGLAEQVEREFEQTSGFQKILDDAGVVNQVIAGNHDNQLGAETGATSRFSQTFGPGRYYEAAKRWPAGASYHAWDEKTDASGTVVEPGTDSQNNYVLFSAGGLDFVAVGLSYGVSKEEAAWASSVFQRYHDRNGILLSHDYLKPSSAPDARGAAFSAPDGSFLYKQVVERNANVFLVLAGHEHGVGTNLKTKVKGGATVFHNVVELLADYQFYTVGAGQLFPDKVDESGNIDVDGDGDADHKATDRLQFGASFLRMLQFDVERGEMSIDTYSPYLDDFGATEYDLRADGSQTKPRYNGSEDNMVLPVDLSTRMTSFSTDSVAAYVPTEVLGTDEVTAGETATATWTGLDAGTSYGWIVTAATADGGSAVAEPAVFRTGQVDATLVATPVTVAYGAVATVPVTVSGARDTGGTVTLSEGGTPLASAEVVDGVASVQVPAGTRPGTHTLAVDYSGSDALKPASGTTTLTVERGGALVTAEAAPVTVGTAGSVSVRVDGAGLPTTGTVTVSEGGTELGSAAVTSDLATVPLPSTLAVGSHDLTVSYSGNDGLAATSTSVALRVTALPPRASTVRATPTARKVTRNKPFAVRVQVAAGSVRPSGRVEIRYGGRRVGTATVNRNGRAVVRLKASYRPGRRTFSVHYLGNADVAASRTTFSVKVVKKPRRR
ncbi:Ig-like domain repeat protein [Nocardioides sp. W7]|uniref:Ig-like domain repeat protein n=1 Tax=Nocardioides sp. W7 TaxID=2931390 RepID=UPI001FD47E8C|nr:Ig-like domain repeat protein [Nocardioides sp. W7]